MYYSAGTYEAFAHPEKPEGVDNKSAYIIGTIRTVYANSISYHVR